MEVNGTGLDTSVSWVDRLAVGPCRSALAGPCLGSGCRVQEVNAQAQAPREEEPE